MASANLASQAPKVKITKQKNRSSECGVAWVSVIRSANDRITASNERRAINMCCRCVINAIIAANVII